MARWFKCNGHFTMRVWSQPWQLVWVLTSDYATSAMRSRNVSVTAQLPFWSLTSAALVWRKHCSPDRAHCQFEISRFRPITLSPNLPLWNRNWICCTERIVWLSGSSERKTRTVLPPVFSRQRFGIVCSPCRSFCLPTFHCCPFPLTFPVIAQSATDSMTTGSARSCFLGRFHVSVLGGSRAKIRENPQFRIMC